MATTSSMRDELRAELVATRAAFLELTGGLTEADWRLPTRNPAWTVGDLLHHLVWSLEQMPREVASARQGKGMFNFPRFVRDPLAALYTRLGARRESLATITRRYDTAHAATLRTLDEVRDDEWQRGAPFWGEGFITIEGLFRAQSRHLMEHRGDVLSIFQDDMTTANRRSHRGNA